VTGTADIRAGLPSQNDAQAARMIGVVFMRYFSSFSEKYICTQIPNQQFFDVSINLKRAEETHDFSPFRPEKF
jgi:hypothetical protein